METVLPREIGAPLGHPGRSLRCPRPPRTLRSRRARPDTHERPLLCGRRQRQLLCIARALLKVSKKVHGGAIVCLDEATSAVDTVTDHLIQRVIRTHLARCTVLTIAHRIGTIVDSDRILVLSQGRVVEYDEPATLRADKASMFSQILSESDAAGCL